MLTFYHKVVSLCTYLNSRTCIQVLPTQLKEVHPLFENSNKVMRGLMPKNVPPFLGDKRLVNANAVQLKYNKKKKERKKKGYTRTCFCLLNILYKDPTNFDHFQIFSLCLSSF